MMNKAVRVVRGTAWIGIPKGEVVSVQVHTEQMVSLRGQDFIRSQHVLTPHATIPGRTPGIIRICSQPVPGGISLGLQESIDIENGNDHDIGVVPQVADQVIIIFGQRQQFDDAGGHFGRLPFAGMDSGVGQHRQFGHTRDGFMIGVTELVGPDGATRPGFTNLNGMSPWCCIRQVLVARVQAAIGTKTIERQRCINWNGHRVTQCDF